MENAELIRKADMALSDLATAGKLNPEQTDRFIRTLIDQHFQRPGLMDREPIDRGRQSELALVVQAKGCLKRGIQERRMNSVASSLMVLLRLLCRESRQRKRTWPFSTPISLPLEMATRWV